MIRFKPSRAPPRRGSVAHRWLPVPRPRSRHPTRPSCPCLTDQRPTFDGARGRSRGTPAPHRASSPRRSIAIAASPGHGWRQWPDRLVGLDRARLERQMRHLALDHVGQRIDNAAYLDRPGSLPSPRRAHDSAGDESCIASAGAVSRRRSPGRGPALARNHVRWQRDPSRPGRPATSPATRRSPAHARACQPLR